MKVYLLKTPEYESENFREVCDLLCSYEGQIEFISSFYEFDKNEFYFLQYELFPLHNFRYPSNDTAIKFDPSRGNPLSWRELFSLCDFYREVFSIEDSAFVALLTKRKNALNWFSAFNKSRNIFVHTAEWEQYTNVNSKYPIAYEIVANVLRALMKIPLELPNAFVHETPKGCVNDLCQDKRQIVLKLQTANICKDCIEKIKAENVGSEILRHVSAIFHSIRNEFIFQTEECSFEPIPLIVAEGGKILFPNQNIEIRLTPLFKTLYLFFLSKPEGVTLNQLSDFKEELLSIYRRLRPSASREDAEIRIEKLSDPFGDGFNPTKTHINKTITELLREPLADFYRISGEKGQPYKIKVPRTLVDIRY